MSAEEILAHPRFDAARAVYIREMLRLHENQPVQNRLLMDSGTAFIFITLITMHAGYRPEERATWPTAQALKARMEAHGIASGRRVHDLVRRLVDIGYAERFSAPADRRTTLLMPTERMLSHDRQALIVYYHPLQVMFPDPGYPELLRADPAFCRLVREIGLAFVAHSQQFIMANPVIAFFIPRQAGHMILTKLMQLCLEQDDSAVPHVSFVEIGDSFGVSRTHVRQLLRAAQDQGLVRLHGRGVALTAACRSGFDRFLADTMAGNDLVYRMARPGISD